MNTTYRDCCGSLQGMVAHQAAGESPCGWCRQAENAARLAAEAITWRPTPPSAALPQAVTGDQLEPVAPVQAAANAALLAAELDAWETEHPEHKGGRRRGGHLHAA